MSANLLIINAFHPKARYVPMGAFGICDHLLRSGHRARIFNGALYPSGEHRTRLAEEVASFSPTAIGLVMQWKEYTAGALQLARELKQLAPERPVLAGGMTAGYFARELLDRYEAIDAVIIGDAEEPLRRLLDGEPWSGIANLACRENERARLPHGDPWQADCRLLDQLSFAGLDFMADSDRYLAAIEPVLGFPVFIGRGCIHGCQYCGGSRQAFERHSRRRRPVFRSTTAVLRDLQRLGRRTKQLYIGYENSTRYLKKLFRLVAEQPDLAGKLNLNYGSWDLPDRELLELYGRAFSLDSARPPILELSPETAIDSDRPLVRDPRLGFTNRALRNTLDTVRDLFGGRLRVEVYYSRYLHTQDTPEKLDRELEGIHEVHEFAQRKRMDNVVVTNYRLATDPGSANWERMMEVEDGGDGLDILLRGIERMGLSSGGGAAADNICLYRPEGLDRETAEAHDQLVSWLVLLHRQRPDCYFTAARAVGFTSLAACLRAVLSRRRHAGWWEEVTLPGLVHLLRGLGLEAADERHGIPEDRRELLGDLCRLHAGHLAALLAGNAGGLVHHPRFDASRHCITGRDLTGPAALESVTPEGELPPGSPTLTVYCGRRMFAFPSRFEPQFRLFDGRRTVGEVLEAIGADGSLTVDETRELALFFARFHRHFTG